MTSQLIGRAFDPIRRLFDRYEGGHFDHGPTEDKIERWKAHDVHFPEDHPNGHESSWTGAPGIWYCQTCHEWYRTWTDTPSRPERQEAGW